MKEYSLVLEGGGAKGAYQIGAIKALMENGYSFDTIVGTSIGAINAAFLVQGDMDKIEKLWKTLSFKDLMDINNDIAESLFSRQINLNVLNELRRNLNTALKAKGIDTALMRKLLLEYIDEDKIRNSNIRFGLVTFCVSDFKPYQLFIEDIPKGKLIDYILASSNLPVFKRTKIEDKSFLDGGTFDNCSVEMLYNSGYRNILALRLHRKNLIRNYNTLIKKKDINLKMIVPSVELPNVLNFETKNLNRLLKYGYIDTIKQLNKLDGKYYTFNKIPIECIDKYKDNLSPLVCFDIVKRTKVRYKVGDNIVDIALKKAMPKINKIISDTKTKTFKKQLINIIEYVAKKENINPNKIYDFDEFVKEVKEKIADKVKIKEPDKTLYYIVQNI